MSIRPKKKIWNGGREIWSFTTTNQLLAHPTLTTTSSASAVQQILADTMTKIDFLLHESALGYALFKVVIQQDAAGLHLKEVQKAGQDLSKFGKMVTLVSFSPWRNAADALSNINDISEGILNDYLRSNLELNLPQAKKQKVVLGLQDKNLAQSIKDAFPGISCETGDTSEVCADLLRGIRLHSAKLLKGLEDGDVERAQLGLGHAYSRGKVKFNVHKNDNHIIRAMYVICPNWLRNVY